MLSNIRRHHRIHGVQQMGNVKHGMMELRICRFFPQSQPDFRPFIMNNKLVKNLLTVVAICLGHLSSPQQLQADESSVADIVVGANVRQMLNQYCVKCHGHADSVAGLDFESADANLPVADSSASRSEMWEKVVRKLRARQMPPGDAPRPDEAT